MFDKSYTAKPSFYAVADTAKPIQTIKTAPALEYDGTDKDYEQSFKYQKANEIGDIGSFKAIWNGNDLIIRVEAYDDYEFIASLGESNNKVFNLKAGSSRDIVFELDKIKKDSSINFEVAAVGTDTAWNTLHFSEGITYGRLNFKEQPVSAKAFSTIGDIKIDGKSDDIDWDMAASIDINKYTMGSDGAYGTAKVCWDSDYIYALVQVKDKKLSKENVNAYEQDTVEIFFDENNGKTSSYESDDIQLRVNYDNEVTVTDGKSAEGYITAASKTADGYIVEAAIPHTIKEFSADQVVGFDVQINDDNGEGKRTGIANWSDLTGQGYIDTSGFGVLELKSSIDDLQVGDINKDGRVNVADLVLLQKYIVRSVRYLENEKLADIDGSGVINVLDAVALRRILL